MLSEIQATSTQGNVLYMALRQVLGGIVVKEVEGLDPVKATIVTSNFPTSPGEQFLSSKRESRDIVLKLALEPDYISEYPRDVRRRLYEFFMPATSVDLVFVDDVGMYSGISGHVESCSAPLFTQDPNMEITIRCLGSDFVATEDVDLLDNTTSTVLDTVLNYPGSVESGTIFELSVNRTVDAFTLYQTLPNGRAVQLDFAWNLVNADVLTIDSTNGHKGITLLRGGNVTSLLYGMSPQSSWITLYPGQNYFRAYALGAGIPFKLSYFPRYGGL